MSEERRQGARMQLWLLTRLLLFLSFKHIKLVNCPLKDPTAVTPPPPPHHRVPQGTFLSAHSPPRTPPITIRDLFLSSHSCSEARVRSSWFWSEGGAGVHRPGAWFLCDPAERRHFSIGRVETSDSCSSSRPLHHVLCV